MQRLPEQTEQVDSGMAPSPGGLPDICQHLGFTFIFGVFQNFYELSHLQEETASSISCIGTIKFALLVIIGVVAGALYDLEAFRLMMVSSSLLILITRVKYGK